MIVITRGDTVLVKYQHTDRNRGVRTATGYRFGNGGMTLAGWTGPEMDFNAVFTRGSVPSPKVRAFVDFLVERLNFDENTNSLAFGKEWF